MPRPRTPKEIKQFLGLTGYYQKFIPHFSEISRPLVKLTAKDTQFEWTPQCQFSFEMLKDALMSAPILKYPDTEKPYTIFTDASKYGWAGVLTQEHTSIIDGKQVTTNHPVAYISVIGTVYPNIPLSSASLHSHPQSSLGATLGVCMSATALWEPLNHVLCMANRCL